jgi:hypothetical protein
MVATTTGSDREFSPVVCVAAVLEFDWGVQILRQELHMDLVRCPQFD